jgi:hypothetical protein
MFADRYFAKRYFAARYWPPVVSITVTIADAGDCGQVGRSTLTGSEEPSTGGVSTASATCV